ncbi:MAG: cellulase family glycosylhydrolase [Verrucomicrobiota bacterium]
MIRSAFLVGCLFSLAVFLAVPASANPAQPLPLHVDGTNIVNSRGETVWLRGVNTPSLEWSSTGEGHILKTVDTAIRDWKVNIIRLPLAQDRWFGKGPEQSDGGAGYRALVESIVDRCSTNSCYVLLDLQWSDGGQWGTNIAMHPMPDLNSLEFWKDCAAKFRNHPAVMFDLYNEPRDVSWDVWQRGGTIADHTGGRKQEPPRQYEAVGMQTLLDAIRAQGATNLVVAGGLDWAYDFSGILNGRGLVDTNGAGVVYANHAYNNKGDSAARWISKMEKAAAQLPVIVSEFGGSGGTNRHAGRFAHPETTPNGDDWLLHVMQALQDHRWSWIAWDLHPFAGPCLVSDWNYTPTPDFGVFVKQALADQLPRYTPPPPMPVTAPAKP